MVLRLVWLHDPNSFAGKIQPLALQVGSLKNTDNGNGKLSQKELIFCPIPHMGRRNWWW